MEDRKGKEKKKRKFNLKVEPECRGRSALFPGGGDSSGWGREQGAQGARRARSAVALPGRRDPALSLAAL